LPALNGAATAHFVEAALEAELVRSQNRGWAPGRSLFRVGSPGSGAAQWPAFGLRSDIWGSQSPAPYWHWVAQVLADAPLVQQLPTAQSAGTAQASPSRAVPRQLPPTQLFDLQSPLVVQIPPFACPPEEAAAHLSPMQLPVMQSLGCPQVAPGGSLVQQTLVVVPSIVGTETHVPTVQLVVQVGKQCAGASAAQAKPLPQSSVVAHGLEQSP